MDLIQLRAVLTGFEEHFIGFCLFKFDLEISSNTIYLQELVPTEPMDVASPWQCSVIILFAILTKFATILEFGTIKR